MPPPPPPSWSLAKIIRSDDGMAAALVGKKQYSIILAIANPSYETTVVETEVAEECQGWTGKQVLIGGIANNSTSP